MTRKQVQPFDQMESLAFDRPWTEMMSRFFGPALFRAEGTAEWAPSVDINETPKSYVISAEVPGMSPDDINISLTGDTITLSGKKSEEERTEEDNVVRTERRYGSFQRSFTFPTSVDADQVDARTQDGLLTIEVAKVEATPPRKIKVRSR